MIKSIQYISCTDEPLIFTGSNDKYVKIHNMDGEERGVLRQGYMIKGDEYNWQFPLSNYVEDRDNRQRTIRTELEQELTSPSNQKRRDRVR